MNRGAFAHTKDIPPTQVDVWRIAGRSLSLSCPVVMGILNLTPDSFSDGGQLPTLEAARTRARRMVAEGAGILDIGGESTRPGADEIPVSVELQRVVPVVEAIAAEFDVPISIDTRKSEVAEAALAAGASIVNDVSALSFDIRMTEVVARAEAGIVLMHMRGSPKDMRARSRYRDLMGELVEELGDAVIRAEESGIAPEAIAVDPGIGFAKTARQSLAVLARLDRLWQLGHPILVGPSRKSFLGEVLGVPTEERAVGTATACALAYSRGARIFRVHDVVETVQALKLAAAVAEAAADAAALGADILPEVS